MMKELLRELVEAYGPSGYEEPVRAVIEKILCDKADDLGVDSLGNLIALKKGTGTGKRVMIAAHMDEIGIVVTYVDKNGFMRFGRVGGVNPQTLVGSRVRFGNGAMGIIGWEKWLQASTLPAWDELFIDVGATSPEDAPMSVGDVACFDRPFVDLGTRWAAKAMDDRVGCAVAIQTLMEMDQSPNDVYFVFTTQEEVGTRGAMVSAFGLEPDVALAVDVTLVGDTPEAHPMAISLGNGVAIKVMDGGMLSHPGVKNWMIDTAKRLGIKYQLEVLEKGTTDAYSMQTTRAGVPAGCLSVPCRYVHTPSEVVDRGDVEAAVRLLAGLVSGEVAV